MYIILFYIRFSHSAHWHCNIQREYKNTHKYIFPRLDTRQRSMISDMRNVTDFYTHFLHSTRVGLCVIFEWFSRIRAKTRTTYTGSAKSILRNSLRIAQKKKNLNPFYVWDLRVNYCQETQKWQRSNIYMKLPYTSIDTGNVRYILLGILYKITLFWEIKSTQQSHSTLIIYD